MSPAPTQIGLNAFNVRILTFAPCPHPCCTQSPFFFYPPPGRYEDEENRTVCACMEATAELFLADGFEPAPGEEEGAAEGGQAAEQQGSAAGQLLGGETLPLPLPRQEPPRVVIEEID